MKRFLAPLAALLIVAGCLNQGQSSKIDRETMWDVFMAIPAGTFQGLLAQPSARATLKDQVVYDDEVNILHRYYPASEMSPDMDPVSASVAAFRYDKGGKLLVLAYDGFGTFVSGVDKMDCFEYDLSKKTAVRVVNPLADILSKKGDTSEFRYFLKEDGFDVYDEEGTYAGTYKWNGSTFELLPDYLGKVVEKLPADAFISQLSAVAGKDERAQLLRDGIYTAGSNEDALTIRAENYGNGYYFSAYNEPELVVGNLRMYRYSGKGEKYLVLWTVDDVITEAVVSPTVMKAYDYNPADGSLVPVQPDMDPVTAPDFADPIISYPNFITEDGEVYQLENPSLGMTIVPDADGLRYYPCSDISNYYDRVFFHIDLKWDGKRFVKDESSLYKGSLYSGGVGGIYLDDLFISADQFPGMNFVYKEDQFVDGIQFFHYDLFDAAGNLVLRFVPYPVANSDGNYDFQAIEVYSPKYVTYGGFGVGSKMKDIYEAPSIFGGDVYDGYLKRLYTGSEGQYVHIWYEGASYGMRFHTDNPDILSEDARVTKVSIEPNAVG